MKNQPGNLIYILFMSVLMVVTVNLPSFAQSTTVRDYRGNAVEFPQGLQSFADSILFTRVGTPSPVELRIPNSALGKPDWNVPDTQTRNFPNVAYSLGCKGQLAVQFEDNALIDVEGPDLYIFEVGANVEPAFIYVSNDGANWEPVGRIGGAFSTIDLAGKNLKSNTYRYVLIEDAGSICQGITPGADVDAIGAIGSANRLTLAGEVLFDVGKFDLRPGAQASLDAIVQLLVSEDPKFVEIAGHTDSTGSDSANFTLGTNRAQSVANYLIESAAQLGNLVNVTSRGEAEPVASNDTSSGRQRNRRVEITVFYK